MCDLWPVAESSQNKRERARSLINREVNKILDGSTSQWIVRLTGQCLVGWKVFYVTGKEFSMNAHPSTQPKKHLSHNQYQTPVLLFTTVFRLITLVQASHPLPYLSNYWVRPFPQNLHPQKIHLFLNAMIRNTLGVSCRNSMPYSWKLRSTNKYIRLRYLEVCVEYVGKTTRSPVWLASSVLNPEYK